MIKFCFGMLSRYIPQTPLSAVPLCHSLQGLSRGQHCSSSPLATILHSCQHFSDIMTAACCLTGALDTDLDDSFQTRKNTNWPAPRIVRLAQKSGDLKTIAGLRSAFSGCFTIPFASSFHHHVPSKPAHLKESQDCFAHMMPGPEAV